MKKGLLSLALLLGASALMQAKGKEDPVLMTVGGKPVTLSEFEYLYHKNNAQQSTPQAIEEYLKLFIPYRQKVAAAEELGLDRRELSGMNSTPTAAICPPLILWIRPWKTASWPLSTTG